MPVSEHAYHMGGSQIWLEPGGAVHAGRDAAGHLRFLGQRCRCGGGRAGGRQRAGVCGTDERPGGGAGDDQHHLPECLRAGHRGPSLHSAGCCHPEPVPSQYLPGAAALYRHLDGQPAERPDPAGEHQQAPAPVQRYHRAQDRHHQRGGVCISASATRDGLTLIAVVLGSPSSADRFHSATTLLDYGFANYAAAPLPTLPERPLALAVKGSAEDSVPLDYAALPETILIEKGTASALRAELTLPEALEAPVEKGQTVGKVSIFQDDTLLNEYEVKAAADAPLLTFGGALELLWQCLLGA